MANQDLQGLKVAILVTDGFEQVELTEPRKALDKGGAKTRVVSPKQGRVRGWKFTERGDDIPVDVTLDQTRPDEFDALLLPGGVIRWKDDPATEFHKEKAREPKTRDSAPAWETGNNRH
jgi:protease I